MSKKDPERQGRRHRRGGFRQDRARPFRSVHRARRFRPASAPRPARKGWTGDGIFLRHAHAAAKRRERSGLARGAVGARAKRRRDGRRRKARSKSSSPSPTYSTSRTRSCCCSNCPASNARIFAASSTATSCCSRRRPSERLYRKETLIEEKLAAGSPRLNLRNGVLEVRLSKAKRSACPSRRSRQGSGRRDGAIDLRSGRSQHGRDGLRRARLQGGLRRPLRREQVGGTIRRIRRDLARHRRRDQDARARSQARQTVSGQLACLRP